jgi:hypothetical protein
MHTIYTFVYMYAIFKTKQTPSTKKETPGNLPASNILNQDSQPMGSGLHSN